MSSTPLLAKTKGVILAHFSDLVRKHETETWQPQRETTKDLGFMSTKNSYLFPLILKYT